MNLETYAKLILDCIVDIRHSGITSKDAITLLDRLLDAWEKATLLDLKKDGTQKQ